MTTGYSLIMASNLAVMAAWSYSPAARSATNCLNLESRACEKAESLCVGESASAQADGSPRHPSSSSAGMRPRPRAAAISGPAIGSCVPRGVTARGRSPLTAMALSNERMGTASTARGDLGVYDMSSETSAVMPSAPVPMSNAILQSEAMPSRPSGASNTSLPVSRSACVQVHCTRKGSKGGTPKISSITSPTTEGESTALPST
mmetsp:Transcript_18001/g.46029  ORF Transcript_18001/g.46029 Transcript_18001/m.46029 type:complete len:204 (-) Transcript_18001:155-766(-)